MPKKKKTSRSPNQPPGKQEAAALRRVQALALRIKGKSFRRIAEETDVSLGQAYQDVEAALEELRELEKDKAADLRRLYVERIEAIIEGHFEQATESHDGLDKEGNKVKLGPDEKSARVILSALERGAKLLGLDAPEKHEHGQGILDQYLEAVYAKRKAAAKSKAKAEK